MAVAIGSPPCSDPRHPNLAVLRVGAPGAVVIQVFIADDIARNVSRRSRSIVVTVAVLAPTIKLIVAACFENIGMEGIRAGKIAAQSRSNTVDPADRKSTRLNSSHSHHRRVP